MAYYLRSQSSNQEPSSPSIDRNPTLVDGTSNFIQTYSFSTRRGTVSTVYCLHHQSFVLTLHLFLPVHHSLSRQLNQQTPSIAYPNRSRRR